METRHNAGFLVIDRIARRYSLKLKKPFLKRYLYGKGSTGNHSFILVKPLTYMNNSGAVIPGLLKKFRIPAERMVIICDNMDLPYGMCRIKKKGSGGGHNGLRSIDSFVGGKEYPRIYVGVTRPKPGVSVVDHVLSAPLDSEFSAFTKGVEKAADAVEMILNHSIEEAMHEYNRKVT